MIMVDAIQTYPECGLRHINWCHMSSDKDADELHAMAHLIGLKREWFQPTPYAHYDLTPLRRAAAVKHGAQEVGAKEGLLRNFDYVAKKAARAL